MKFTVADAALEAMRIRGEPLTARQTLQTILENRLYSFGAAKPVDVVRHELKRLCGPTKGDVEPPLEEYSGKRYFIRNFIENQFRDSPAKVRQLQLEQFGGAKTEKRQTIIRAIRHVMAVRGRAMTIEEVYSAILRDNLYQFKAHEPIHVVRSQIRRHSLGLDFPSASETKHFELTRRGRYRLLENTITQKSKLGNVGIAIRDAIPVSPERSNVKEAFALRTEVFVSYSHRDKKWMERLQIHLAPLERQKLVTRWDDTKIKAGGKWRKEIAAALNRASIAVLLVSADFLASKFIVENELPPLLKAVNTKGIRILPVIVSPCRFEKSDIAEFQALNPPEKPLNSLQKAGYERIFVQIADAVESAIYGDC
jgi:hypothetical protein